MKKARKWLSLLLAVVLVVGLLPVTAQAALEYDVWVGGVRVDSSNASDVLGDGTVVFTPATGSEPARLALYNANITCAKPPDARESDDEWHGIKSEIDLTLELHRTNTISPADNQNHFYYYGIQAKDLVIMGDGTLDVTAGKGGMSYAVSGGKLTMRGGTVRATANQGYDLGSAFTTSEFTMEGGTLEATAYAYRECMAFRTSKLTMLGGTIRATAGDTTEQSVAVEVYDEMTMLGGTFQATAGEAPDESIAFRASKFVMESGTLEATAGKGKNSCAISASKMTARGGTIRATAGKESTNSYAVSSKQLVMEGGTLEATADKGKFTCGVNADSMTVLGGAIQATAGSASTYCKGVSAGEFTMEDGSLIAQGGEAPESWGADVKGAITGGVLTVIGQTDAFYSAPDLSGYANPVVTVNTEASEIGASTWNGTDKLSSDGDFKYVKVGSFNPFTDVAEGAFYYEPVLWAVNHGPQITNGTSATTFSPNATCTRGQVVTFLWRAAGAPEPTMALNPFSDVKEGAFYYKAVLWAVQTGITKGVDATHFGPDRDCTRGQVVAFLHRSIGTPPPGSDVNPFVDVKEGAFYYDAVLWAVEKNVTKGTSETTFSPNATCTRGQIVTFLYRAQK